MLDVLPAMKELLTISHKLNKLGYFADTYVSSVSEGVEYIRVGKSTVKNDIGINVISEIYFVDYDGSHFKVFRPSVGGSSQESWYFESVEGVIGFLVSSFESIQK